MLKDMERFAREAGEIIRSGFNDKLDIQYKSSEFDIVTNIDKEAELSIVNNIKLKYPKHSILAEESGEVKNDSDYLWVIDPLDGTTNFAHGLPVFSVSIGVQKNSQSIFGCIYHVMNDDIYTCSKGGGSFKNGENISVRKNDNLAQSLLVTGFPYNVSSNPNDAIMKFRDFLCESRSVRRLGSAAIDLAYVSEGIFDGFWEVNLNPWDVCAGILLVEEAGGVVTNYNGIPIDIYSKEILASNGFLHKEMIRVLNK